MAPTCCKSVSAAAPIAVVDDPFSPMIVLDYYDGPVGGFLKCRTCGAAYHFHMLDWDAARLTRIFALTPISEATYQRVLAVLGAHADRHVWIPPVLSRASEEAIEGLYQAGIQKVVDDAGKPSVAVAWSVRAEKTLTTRGIDPSAAEHLAAWFDRQPERVDFDWSHYLNVARPLQRA